MTQCCNLQNKSSLVIGVIIFISIFSFFWCLLFSFRPSFVCETEDGKICDPRRPDVIRCMFCALIIALFIIISIWMFGSC